MSTCDDISKLYDYSNIIKKISDFFAYFNIIGSIILLFSKGSVENFLSILLIVTMLIFVILSAVDNCFFWFNAESTRRMDAISNGFAIKIHEYKTDGYYNNNVDPSIVKYAKNSFESVLFSKNNSKRMLLIELIKTLLIISLFIISCRIINNNNIILIIAQTAFSSFFVIGFIELCCYYFRVNNLYKLFYKEFITIGISDNKQIIILLVYSIEYEAIKAYFKIRLSKTIFNKNNIDWSKKWADIENEITIYNTVKE